MNITHDFITFIRVLEYIQFTWEDLHLREDFSVSKRFIEDTVNNFGYEFIDLSPDFILSFRERGIKSYYQISSSKNELIIRLVESQ